MFCQKRPYVLMKTSVCFAENVRMFFLPLTDALFIGVYRDGFSDLKDDLKPNFFSLKLSLLPGILYFTYGQNILIICAAYTDIFSKMIVQIIFCG